MGLEAATYINDLVTSNPVSGDDVAQGDDHLRLLKSVLQGTFPGASKAFYFPTTAAKSANYTILSSEQNKTFVSTTSGGSFTYTLPTLAAGDAGWECFFIKIGTDTNPFFVAPASGTIQSGDQSALAKVRRCIPGVRTGAFWTGSVWLMSRATDEPIGAVVDTWRSAVPVGYENANGATLASASTNYPEFYKANGNSGVLPDVTGRVTAGKEASATRLTSAVSGIDGSVLGAAGGDQKNTIAQSDLPNVSPTFIGTAVPNHTHGGAGGKRFFMTTQNTVPDGGAGTAIDGVSHNTGSTETQTGADGGHTPAGTISSINGNVAQTNLEIVQPTIVVLKVVVVE